MGPTRKNKAASVCVLILLLACIAGPALGADLENRSELEAFLDGVFSVQLKQYRVPGITVAVVKDGEVWFSKGYGFSNLERKIPANPAADLHRVGSNSKILVWTAVMQLVEQKRLELYADLNTYLDFTIPSTTLSGAAVVPITLHHLLTHTAGFEEELTGLFASDADFEPLSEYLPKHLPARVFPPGAIMSYSNYGAALAAYVVELVSGRPFDEYVAEHILEPLQMTASTFSQPIPPSLAPRLMTGYRYQSGRQLPAEFEYIQAYPTGALTATTLNMANLIIAHLGLGAFDEGRILQEETARLMQSEQFSKHPALPGMSYGFIRADYNGTKVLAQGGDTLMFTTGLYFLPEEQVGLYVAYNRAVGEAARRSFLESFLNRYFPGEPHKAVPQPITGNTAQYQGSFYNARSNFSGPEIGLRLVQNMVLDVDQEGFLTVSLAGESRRYGEIGPDLFQAVNGAELLALGFSREGRLEEIYFPGPETWLRTPRTRTPLFLLTVAGISLLVLLGTMTGWLIQLFRPLHRQTSLAIPKILGVLFNLVLATTAVILIRTLNDLHPNLAIPRLFVENQGTLKMVVLLTKALIGLDLAMLLTTVYLWFTAKGSLWQRAYYTLFTFSATAIVWLLWQVNL